jgi:hypothetical protein
MSTQSHRRSPHPASRHTAHHDGAVSRGEVVVVDGQILDADPERARDAPGFAVTHRVDGAQKVGRTPRSEECGDAIPRAGRTAKRVTTQCPSQPGRR